MGKTSFLRLIPLFYGALPSRILRGSGHTSMIRHVLPRPDSAVVYEYERETESDLRCTVMFASPDESLDAPVFYIVHAGYEERFFLDAAGKFLTRDDFKAHVEGMGIPVSMQMALSDYRGVILGAVGLTKEATKFRRLAVLHSLGGPGSMHGLEDIAAAMGPESISFQTLQSIVVDQVAMEISGDGKAQRELRKSAADVEKWLQIYDHLAKLSARQGEAERLAGTCKDIEQSDGQLRELRRAVLDLLENLADRRGVEERALAKARADGEEQQQALAHQATQAHERAQRARQQVRELGERVSHIESRERHFLATGEGRGAEALLQEQQQEAALQRDEAHLRAALAELERQAAGIVATYNERRQAVQLRLQATLTDIAGEQGSAESTLSARLRELSELEKQELAQLAPPEQLATLQQRISQIGEEIARLRGQADNPAPSEEAAAAWEEARAQVQEAHAVHQDASDKLAGAQQQEHRAERAQAQALADHANAARDRESAAQSVAKIEQQLRPPAGSLLAFMREEQFEGRQVVARVLDPQLLLRDDLKPQQIEAAATGTTVAVGQLALDVRAVPEPEWLEATGSRAQLDAARGRLQAIEERLRAAETRLEEASGGVRTAQSALAQALTQKNARAGDLKRLQQAEADAKRRLNEEKAARATEIAARIGKLEEERTAQRARFKALEETHSNARAAIASGYAQRAAQAQNERDAAVCRANEARAQAERVATAGTEELNAQERQETAAAGVDTAKQQKLRTQYQKVSERLQGIARWRQEVQAWVEFRDGDLQRLQALREQRTAAEAEHGQASADATSAEQAQQNHATALREDIIRRENLIQRISDDHARLDAMLQQELLAIGEAPAGRVVQSWEAGALLTRVAQERRRLSDLRASASNIEQGLRSLMRLRPGPVQDWIDQQEGELGPLLAGLADHQQVMQRGRLIGQWFTAGYQEVVQALNAALHGNLHAAKSFVAFLDGFDRRVLACNNDLQKELAKVKPFPSFRDLAVHVRSSVRELEYMPSLQRMADMADSLAPTTRMVYGQARQLELPDSEAVRLMKSFHDLLKAEGGIKANLSDLVRLECSITINGKNHRISSAEEFKKHASNGNTGMIVAMFLMGFAGVVRRSAKASVRLTWITDETGRFDAENLQQFLRTLDENNIDVISAQPEANPATLDLFDTECRFGTDGRIDTIAISQDDWDSVREESHVAA